MNRMKLLMAGAVVILAFATLMLVILPAWQIRTLEPSAGLKPYTAEEYKGRESYIANGCMYCHSQQPRSVGQTSADLAKGWGRASTPADYAFDRPHQLGTMRTGPDLLNVGVRFPSQGWHLTHLYQPRDVVDWSIMPAYPYLFEVKDKADEGDILVKLPVQALPQGKVVVATPEALELVAYLLSLDRSYPMTAEEASLRDQGYDEKVEQNPEKAGGGHE